MGQPAPVAFSPGQLPDVRAGPADARAGQRVVQARAPLRLQMAQALAAQGRLPGPPGGFPDRDLARGTCPGDQPLGEPAPGMGIAADHLGSPGAQLPTSRGVA